METYKAFLDRINSFEKREVYYGTDYFNVNPSIAQKVGKDNAFKPFYGDTIVFNPDDSTKNRLEKYVEQLYQLAPECFCEKLVSSTFHMTLHDMSNSPVLQNVAPEVFENEIKIAGKIKEIPKYHKIKMKSKYIFNMVNTSLVLGFYPASEAEYNKLMELYCMFDDVKELSYPFTPHITLAYYSVNGFDVESARKLETAVFELNNYEMDIELDIDNLYYQKFVSMNEYINIINLGNGN